jgi:NAD(P)-dependent dehydrogenase (short-subunit alcohol dehydrogenase family)
MVHKMKNNFIVMGAHGGIGEELTLRLKGAGHYIVATMRDPSKASQSLQSENIDIRAADVTDFHSIEAAFLDFTNGKPLSGFAYCIGSIEILSLRGAKEEQYLRAYDVNVMGVIRALKILEGALKAGNGSVVLFSSIAVQQGFPNHTIISSAKGAVEGFARALAAEWAGHVRVNCIAPSLTDTAIAEPLTSMAPMRQAIEKMHPIARLGTPQDSAALADFLLCPQSSWITGQIMHVDGGRSTLRPK